MIQEDLAIKYQAKLIEVQGNLEKLKTLEIKTTMVETEINKIDSSLEKDVADCYEKFSNMNSDSMLKESLSSIYNIKMKSLDKINDRITSEYEEYHKIYTDLKYIQERLKENENIELSTIVSNTLSLLKRMRYSSTIDYEQERKIVEEVYQVVYQVMKIELVSLGTDTILNEVKNHEQDISYITKLIKEEGLKLQDSNKQIQLKLREIDKYGFDNTYYLDKDLIKTLALLENPNLLSPIKDNFLTKLENYQDVLNKIQKGNQLNEKGKERVLELKKINKKLSYQKLGKKISLCINLGLLAVALFHEIKFSKNLAVDTVYKTTTIVYDSSNPNQGEVVTKEEYVKEMENSIHLVEYSPWDRPGYFRSKYKRTVYTYFKDSNRSSNFNLWGLYDNLEEYLSSDLKNVLIYNETTESSTEIPEDLNSYSENKYVITQVKQDRSMVDKKDSPVKFILISGSFSIITIIIDACVYHFVISKNSLKSLRNKKEKGERILQTQEQLLLENQEQLRELYRELSTLKYETQDEYNHLPTLLQQDEEVKQKMLVIKENSINHTIS